MVTCAVVQVIRILKDVSHTRMVLVSGDDFVHGLGGQGAVGTHEETPGELWAHTRTNTDTCI